jgi:hypothetical protein
LRRRIPFTNPFAAHFKRIDAADLGLAPCSAQHRPPQRTHCSISIPNTRFSRCAQFSATCFGVARSASPLGAFEPRPAGVIAARSAALAANTPAFVEFLLAPDNSAVITAKGMER